MKTFVIKEVHRKNATFATCSGPRWVLQGHKSTLTRQPSHVIRVFRPYEFMLIFESCKLNIRTYSMHSVKCTILALHLSSRRYRINSCLVSNKLSVLVIWPFPELVIAWCQHQQVSSENALFLLCLKATTPTKRNYPEVYLAIPTILTYSKEVCNLAKAALYFSRQNKNTLKFNLSSVWVTSSNM